MIKLTVTGQTLAIVTSKVVAGTHDYLEVEGDFRTPDWRELRKWVHFMKDELHYVIPMHDDRISAEQHLDLTAGTWEVYVHGNYIDDDEVTERVTTGIRYLWVEGPHEGHPFPELTPDLSEILANDVEQALDIAQSVRDDADAGVFDGATYLPNVDEDGIISWTNDKEKPNPEPQNIRGPQGPVGDTTVKVSDTPPEDPRINVWIDPNGQVGKVIVRFEQISGSHQPGTYDTYRMTFHDGTYVDMQVYNGVDGEGTGDMLKSVYDTANKALDVYDYADEAAEEAAGAVKDTTGVSGLLKGSGGSIVAATPGTDYQTPLTIDTEMDDDSTNPVQNKIIKEYIDNNASKIFICTYGETTFAEITAAISAGKLPILVKDNNVIPMNHSSATSYHFNRFYSDGSTSVYRFRGTEYWVSSIGGGNAWYADLDKVFLARSDIESAVSQSGINPVSGSAIYQALQGKQDRLTIDTAMSNTSVNPVQNRAIKQYVDSKIGTVFGTAKHTFTLNNQIPGGGIGGLTNQNISRAGFVPVAITGYGVYSQYSSGARTIREIAVMEMGIQGPFSGDSYYADIFVKNTGSEAIPAGSTVEFTVLYLKQ